MVRTFHFIRSISAFLIRHSRSLLHPPTTVRQAVASVANVRDQLVPSGRVTVQRRFWAGADAIAVDTPTLSGGCTTMPFVEWLAQLRQLLAHNQQTDGDV